MGLPYEREAQIGHMKITQSIEEKIEQKEVTHLIEQITLHGYQTQKTNEIDQHLIKWEQTHAQGCQVTCRRSHG